MKTILMIKSSIKKNRSSSITLLFLIMLATIFLYIGFNVMLNLNSFIDSKNTSINGADFVVSVPKASSDDYIQIISGMEHFKSLEAEDSIFYTSGEIINKKVEQKAQTIGFVFLNADIKSSISKMIILDQKGEQKENSIIIPYSLKTAFGYQSGDEIEITCDNHKMTYVIYGFSEDVLFSTANNNNYYKCFIPNDLFMKQYHSSKEANRHSFIKTLITDGESTEAFEDAFVKKVAEDTRIASDYYKGLNYDVMKTGAKGTINIIMVILVIFSLLILIISMVVIRFSIISHIEEEMKNIGSLEAVGFTNAMIRKALILQFLMIAGIGYLFGILISTLCSNTVTNLVSSSVGLSWELKMNYISLLLSFIIILALITVITLIVTHRIKKITPLIALRNGINTFHFQRNYLPLEDTNGNLHILLGLKQIFHNKKQSISIGIISILMSFTLVFCFAMYHNFINDDKAFFNLIGLEKADISVYYTGTDYEQVFDMAAKQSGIKKAIRYTTIQGTITKDGKEKSTNLRVCEDYSLTEINTITEGRNPSHDNEIVLSTVLCDKLNVKCNDIVSLSIGDNNYDFMVVGIAQHISNLGLSASLTEEGMKRCSSSFEPNTLCLYLDSTQDIQSIINELNKTLEAYPTSISNLNDIFATVMSSVVTAVTALCIFLAILTMLIIALILYYLVKVKIIREQLLIGTQKSLGFTTGQLILHTNISFGSVIVISSFLGSILAVILINPMCTLMFSMSSIRSCNFTIPSSIILLAIVIISFVAILTTTLVSFRIRKLTPRSLMLD